MNTATKNRPKADVVPIKPRAQAVDPLPYLSLKKPPSEPTSPTPKRVAEPATPAKTSNTGMGAGDVGNVEPEKRVAQKQDRPTERYADEIRADLLSGELKASKLSAAAIQKHKGIKNKATQKKVMDLLVKKGVVEPPQKGKASKVTEKYRYNPPESEVEEDKLTKQLIGALTGRNFGWAKDDAEEIAKRAKGDTLDARVTSALRLVGK